MGRPVPGVEEQALHFRSSGEVFASVRKMESIWSGKDAKCSQPYPQPRRKPTCITPGCVCALLHTPITYLNFGQGFTVPETCSRACPEHEVNTVLRMDVIFPCESISSPSQTALRTFYEYRKVHVKPLQGVSPPLTAWRSSASRL